MKYEILTPLIPFALGIILKTLLDFNMAFFIIRYFYWVPVRAIFRKQTYNVSGTWDQIWDNKTSSKYQDEAARKSKVNIKQFGSYCYGEFRALNDEEYYIFGEIIGKNIIGKWGDKNNPLGYFGSFELRIIDNTNLNGIWLGHSNTKPDLINTNTWIWSK